MPTTADDDALPKTSDQLDDKDKEHDAAAQEEDEEPGQSDETVVAPAVIAVQGAVAQPVSEE